MGPGIKRCKWKWHHYYCEWFISKKFFFLSSSSCWFCWSVGLQRKECFWQKIQGDSPELEAKTATWPLWAPLPLNQQGNMGITTLARRTDPDYQREIGKAESLCCPLETITTLLIGYACMLSYLPLARDHRETPNRGITTLRADPWSGQKHALLQTSPLSCHPLVEQVCSLTHLHSAFLPSPYITSSPALSPRYCNYLQWWSKREMMSQVWTWFSKENPWPFSMYLCIWVM